MKTLGICLNTKINALSQYSEFDFNSTCLFNGKVLGASSSGIFEHSGDTDNGVDISSFFKYPSISFDIPKQKRVRRIYVNGYIGGDIEVTVITDKDAKTKYTVAKSVIDDVAVVIDTNYYDKGDTIGLLIGNKDGADFSISSIYMLITTTNLYPVSGLAAGRAKIVLKLIEVSASAS